MPFAPALGWAVHNAATLPLFLILGFSAAGTAVMATIAAAASLVFLMVKREAPAHNASIPSWTYAAAALLALAPAAAVAPEPVGDGIALADPIFDHAKVPIIDAMARLGFPPANPFFGEFGDRGALAYYYLWHFSAAQIALLLGLTGWEADIALTWFSAFASLTLMMGLACWLGARSAAGWAVLFAATGSLRFPLAVVLGSQRLEGLLAYPTGFTGWLFQSAWVPQHLISACCSVVAVLLMPRLVQPSRPLLFVIFILVAVAAFESSIWIGGITLAVSGIMILLAMLPHMNSSERARFALKLAAAAVLSVALAAAVLRAEMATLAARGGGFPIVLDHFSVLGDWFPQALRRLLDLPAYWLLLLPIELPATFVPGVLAAVLFMASGKLDEQRSRDFTALAALGIAGLTIPWLLSSTVGENNNDLALRAVLPAAMVLVVASAAGMSVWINERRRVLVGLAGAGLLLGLIDAARLVYANTVARPPQPGRAFAQTPRMWEAVRRHAGPAERLGNNPLFLAAMTPWPANLSWALLSNRSSCFAGRELALVFAPLSRTRREEVNALFVRVFDGSGNDADVRQLAVQFGCRVIVLTAQDPAWAHDPFAVSGFYRLVESSPDEWRIYRSILPDTAAERP
jgi:hypothetical protein